MPSREVYLRGVINLYFVRNKLCNFFGVYPSTEHKYILRSATPLCTGEVTNAFLFVHLHRRRASFLFCEAPPPLRSTGGDDDCETCCSPSGLVLILHAFAFEFAREDLHRVRATGFC